MGVDAPLGEGGGQLLSSSTATIDHLTGNVTDVLASSGLQPLFGMQPVDVGQIADGLAGLPASVLGGVEGRPGPLGEMFYDDGRSTDSIGIWQALDGPAIGDVASLAIGEALPLELGFIGQSDPGDAAAVSGFLGHSNPLHLV